MEEQKDAVKCPECGAQLESKEQLEGHMQRAHQAGGTGDSGSDKGMQSDVQGMQSGGQMTPEP